MSGQDTYPRHSVRELLERSVSRTDARTRSRLTQARHVALDAAGASRRLSWLITWRAVPITGAVAAAVLAALLLFGYPPVHAPVAPGALTPGAVTPGAQPSPEVLDLLADDEGLSLMEDYDHSFYEWAAAQDENEEPGAKASG